MVNSGLHSLVIRFGDGGSVRSLGIFKRIFVVCGTTESEGPYFFTLSRQVRGRSRTSGPSTGRDPGHPHLRNRRFPRSDGRRGYLTEEGFPSGVKVRSFVGYSLLDPQFGEDTLNVTSGVGGG